MISDIYIGKYRFFADFNLKDEISDFYLFFYIMHADALLLYPYILNTFFHYFVFGPHKLESSMGTPLNSYSSTLRHKHFDSLTSGVNLLF